MKIQIKNADIITMNDDRPVILGGSCEITDKLITYVGEEREGTFNKVIDARGGILMPGLVNAHTHIPMTLFRGYADDLELHSWLFDKIFPAEDKLSEETVYAASILACAEMIKSGTTTFSDMYFFSDSVAKACIETKMKANISRCVSGLDDSFRGRLSEALALYDEFNEEADGKIKIELALHAIYTCSKEAISKVADEAKRLGTNIHVHLSETMKENEDCVREYKMSPTEVMNELGVFDVRTNAAHGVYLSDADMEILGAKGVSISHNPTSNLKLASGICDVLALQKKGINVAIGTDGASSNNSLNMFGELKLSALLQKGIKKDPTALCAYEALKMATVGGAKALGRDNCGQIKENMQADIIILDADAPSLVPVFNPISTAVYSASGAEVKTSIIDGEIVMEDGELKTIDILKAKKDAILAVKKMGL